MSDADAQFRELAIKLDDIIAFISNEKSGRLPKQLVSSLKTLDE